MEHRGASGADNATGDGAGAMVTIAHELFQEELRLEIFLCVLHLTKLGEAGVGGGGYVLL